MPWASNWQEGGCQDDPDDPAVIKSEMMAVEEEEGEEEVAALLHNYLNMVEVREWKKGSRDACSTGDIIHCQLVFWSTSGKLPLEP